MINTIGDLLRALRAPLHDLRHRPQEQIAALDALRTCAVLFVIGYHTAARYSKYGGQDNGFAHLPFIHSGWVGVDLFFVLSGYFIGRQLWRELARTNSISISRFVIRRGLRIWPLYYCTLLWVWSLVGPGPWSPGPGWTDLLFVTNYIPRGIVGGSWSLCIEEQFYIVAPLVILLASRCLVDVGHHRLYLFALLALIPMTRAALWYSMTGNLSQHDEELGTEHFYAPFHTRCDGLIVGLIIANIEVTSGRTYRHGFFDSGYAVFAAFLLFVGIRWLHKEIFYYSGLAIFFGFTCWYLIARPRPWLSFLNSWWFYLISRLSFGMYLSHFYLLDPVIKPCLEYVPGAATMPAIHEAVCAALVTVASALFATATFCLVEYPFLRLRDRVLASMKKGASGRPLLTTDGSAVSLDRARF